VITVVPAPTILNVVPSGDTNATFALELEKVTILPEVAVAVGAKSATPYVTGRMESKVIV